MPTKLDPIEAIMAEVENERNIIIEFGCFASFVPLGNKGHCISENLIKLRLSNRYEA